VRAIATMAAGARTVLAVLCPQVRTVLEADQGVEVRITFEDDVTPVTTIAAVRPALRDALLAPQAGRTVSPASGSNIDGDGVDEHDSGPAELLPRHERAPRQNETERPTGRSARSVQSCRSADRAVLRDRRIGGHDVHEP